MLMKGSQGAFGPGDRVALKLFGALYTLQVLNTKLIIHMET